MNAAVRPPGATAQRRVMLAVGVAIAGWLLFLPAKQLVTETVRIGQLEARLERVEASNERLRAEVRRLEDPAQLELLARDRLGWVRPGERAYLVARERPPVAAADEEPVASWWSRMAEHVVRFVRGDG